MLVFVPEFIESLYAVLERPDVAEPGIGCRNDFRAHRIWGDREVETSETARHGHAVQSGFDHGIHVCLGAGSIFHTSVRAVRSFEIDTFRIGCDHFSGDFTGYFQDLVVGVDGIRIILRSIVIFVLVPIVAFFKFADALHHRVVQMIAQLRVFCIEIGHIICCVICNT